MRIESHPLLSADAVQKLNAEATANDTQLHRLFQLLRGATGVDFTHYKQPTIRRRLHRRMVLHKLDSLELYIKFLDQHPPEVHQLYQDLLIHVTRFFREPETFATLRTKVFPAMLSSRRGDDPLRVWVPGCSTGEEPYSVAIALLEFLAENAGGVPIQVFATDISETAIDHARRGLYPESIAADVSPERLRRFFARVDGCYQISKTVRDVCIFARQDLTRDPPFSKLDLIVCRNVLIYLGAILQKRLMTVFHYALRPGRFLMLGGAEGIGTHEELFAVADKRHKLYTKKTSGARHDLDMSMGEHHGRGKSAPPRVADVTSGTIQNEATRVLLARFSPPGVVVDLNMRIVQFRGQTGPYLEPAPGEASFNLLKMAREGLLFGLRSAMNEARQNDAPARRSGLRVRSDGRVREVAVEVLPLNAPGEGRYFLVLFEESIPSAPAAPSAGKARTRDRETPTPTQPVNKRFAELQKELAANREYLQSIIQDLEAANEELQSANEEILSSNEELQSTNEELDTAKEELQSTNEELNTVNEELQGRNEELTRVNSDLVNLLGSVQIAIVMIAGDLRIRRFTPMAEKVLNLIPSDVGRPISDIKPNINCADLEELIMEAVDTVSVKETECRDREGNWYSLRIRPYKSVDNRIDGAVLALFDTTAAREQETRIRSALQEVSEDRDYADAIVNAVRQPLVVLDDDLTVHRVNRAFLQTFQVTSEETQRQRIYDLQNGQWDIPRLRSLLEEILPQNGVIEDFEVEHEFAGRGRRVMRLNARKIPPAAGRPARILLAIDDGLDAQ